MDTAEAWIERLGLEPLVTEGGYYRETHRSDETLDAGVLPVRYASPRSFYSAIYYLLTPDTFSALHRLESDEIWTCIAGDTATMLQLFETGTGREVKLSNGGAPGTEPQAVVPRRVWQGCRLDDGGRFALFGITVAPGYDALDFQAARREALLETYPAFAAKIEGLLPEDATPE